MNGRAMLREMASLERAAITDRGPPTPPSHLRCGPADPEELARLVAEMISWETDYSRERRHSDKARRHHRRGLKVVGE